MKISLDNGEIINETKKTKIQIDKILKFLLEILEAGGILNKIKHTIKN